MVVTSGTNDFLQDAQVFSSVVSNSLFSKILYFDLVFQHEV